MPTLTADDRVEGPACGLPGFERRHFDVHSAALRELGHPYVRVDSEHRATGRLKLPRHDARPGVHIENDSARGGSNDALDQGLGIARPHAVSNAPDPTRTIPPPAADRAARCRDRTPPRVMAPRSLSHG